MNTFDHPALFQAVKTQDSKRLQQVLTPTLKAFGSYEIRYWDHARDGILTSIKALPGTQGYHCMRWAEQLLNNSHHESAQREPRSDPAARLYQLRADLLGNAIERIADFKPREQSAIRESIADAIAVLDRELTDENLPGKEWLASLHDQL